MNDIKKAIETLQAATANCTTGDRHLVVLDRGWVFAGNLSQDEHGVFTINNCKNVRKWSSGGFGGLALSAKNSGAVLDDCAPVKFEASARIFVSPISESWDE
ncbi:MAG: hypothetical protein GY841_22440 [FCB group bacterium]|nr:hypothetical protein [FCB group bacterium]